MSVPAEARCTGTLRVGITLGDVTGIGPEVVLKALSKLGVPGGELEGAGAQVVILGDPGWFSRMQEALGSAGGLPAGDSSRNRFTIVRGRAELLPPSMGAGDPRASRAAVEWLEEGARLCLAGELEALVTAPVNKDAINRAGVAFVGQTELLADAADIPNPVMMLLGHDAQERWLRVALTTTHLALRAVPDAVTGPRITRAIEQAAGACPLLGLSRARVGVCGLNPHAGEGGQFGREEIELIEPTVKAARERGWDVHGPLAADTLFHEAVLGAYDVVVAMYHDQGLGPLKLIAFDTGVNWTLGLPFVRTSPDHGTAYGLVGRHVARPDSMEAAIRMALRVAKARRATAKREGQGSAGG